MFRVKIVERVEEYGFIERQEYLFATKADAEKYISQLQPRYEAIRGYEVDVREASAAQNALQQDALGGSNKTS
ncbi:hypothetical protein EB118_17605 [bacterium]|nr:hypothetical protein [bacterium]NDG31875.1 hypothetical protein [bacterium]